MDKIPKLGNMKDSYSIVEISLWVVFACMMAGGSWGKIITYTSCSHQQKRRNGWFCLQYGTSSMKFVSIWMCNLAEVRHPQLFIFRRFCNHMLREKYWSFQWSQNFPLVVTIWIVMRFPSWKLGILKKKIALADLLCLSGRSSCWNFPFSISFPPIWFNRLNCLHSVFFHSC